MSEEICFASARELARRIRARELSAREVVQAHLDQIERTNPQVNAIVTLAERAAEQARDADERLAAGELPGPLHGLPVAHKDTHATGASAPRPAHRSSPTTSRTRTSWSSSGCAPPPVITLGKTNVPEFAAGSHTFNPLFGLTRNPYDPSRSAGGSSGGAAAALACGMHPLADGSDMGGSLRNPASFCNVVGFRPSPGRVPSWCRVGWATMGVQGPMAREVADVALLLSVLAGPDPRSPIALDTPGSAFAGPLDRDLAGLRVAWSPTSAGRSPSTRPSPASSNPPSRCSRNWGARSRRRAPT